MIFSKFFSSCWFSHDDPIKVMQGKTFVFQCPSCLQVIHTPLKYQKKKYKQSQSTKSKVLKMAAQASRRA